MPFQSMPYATPTLYQPRDTGSIAELIMRRGDIAARQAEQSGALWGHALANIGNIVGGALAQRQEQKEQSKRDAALSQFIDSGMWQDPKVALAGSVKILGPRDGPRFAEGLIGVAKMNTAQDPAEAMRALPMVARGLLAAPDSMKPGLYGSARTLMINAKLMTPDQLPEEWTPELAPVVGAIAGQKEEEGFTLSPGAVRFDPTGKQVAAVPAAPKEEKKYQVTVPGPGGPITRLASEAEMQAGIREYQKPPAALIVNPEKEEDAKTLAQQLIDGRTTPATLSKRGDYNHILALADRLSQQQGKGKLNPTKLQLDYSSAARHVAAMNGPQMVRFRALAESVVNTMDEVKALAEELKQGGVQRWNQAKRDTVLEVYGNTPQSALAARYVSAVNTLKEEFANLAQGGYAPTEDAWKLANEQINGNFGLKDMAASLTEAQRLINYRMDAFVSLAPQFVGGAGSVGGALGTQPTGSPAGPDTGGWTTLPGGIRIREKR